MPSWRDSFDIQPPPMLKGLKDWYGSMTTPDEEQEDITMPTPPASPIKSRELPTSPQLPPPGFQGGGDINSRADALIGSPEPLSVPAMPVQGLRAAGSLGAPAPKVEPMEFSFGPESAKPTTLPSPREAASTFTGGTGGEMGSQKMSPDLAAFTQLLNANKSGMPGYRSDILAQEAKNQMDYAAGRSHDLEAQRDKTRAQGLEEEKIRQPATMQTALFGQQKELAAQQAAAALERQQAAGSQAQELEKLRQEPARRYYEQLQQTLGGGRGRDIHSFNPKSGATTYETQRAPSTPLLKAVEDARIAMHGQGDTHRTWAHPFSGEPTGASEAFDSAVHNYIASSSAASHVKQSVLEEASKPENKGKTVEDIWDVNAMTPQEYQEIQELWLPISGRQQ
jgi:hypothetical protein